MSDSGNVKLVFDDGEVNVYVHWHGRDINAIVASALARRERWDDPEYLARIIVSRIAVVVGIGDSTGMGIRPKNSGDDPGPVVDLEDNLVTVDGETYTFEQFIAEAGNL